jgi:transposase-like protein
MEKLQMAKRGVGWHSPAFREMALERLRTCEHIGKLCEELGVNRNTLRHWRRQMEARSEQATASTVAPAGETLEQENRRLKRALAQKVLEVDFLQGALHQVEARRRRNIASGAQASTPKSGE